MANLVVDIGNSLIKTAVFDNEKIIGFESFADFTENNIGDTLNKHTINAVILSSVKEYNKNALSLLKDVSFFIELDHQTPFPIDNCYKTPETLGMDRLAGAVGAAMHFPGKNVLVIDTGTCITYDLITSEKKYLGGSISPGLQMRFKALHNFTNKLPLIKKIKDIDYLIGRTTNESVMSGVINGTLAEVDQIINKYRQDFSNLHVIIGGGDVIYFDKKLKNRIFAFEKIVLYGLNEILKYNVHLSKHKQ